MNGLKLIELYKRRLYLFSKHQTGNVSVFVHGRPDAIVLQINFFSILHNMTKGL
jgi:hypothetical protein